VKTWIVAAVESELGFLKNELRASPGEYVGGKLVYVGSLGSDSVYLDVLGVSAVSAALSLGIFLSAAGADRVIMVGSAGALPRSGLTVGDVAVANSEIMAELGVCSGPGMGDVMPMALEGLHQEILLDPEFAQEIADAASELSPIHVGKFLTVLGVSADQAQAEARGRRFSALVENMEGFSLALAGQRFGIPVAEVRGVSNFAGNRDKTGWDLRLANERAQQAVLAYLRRQS
jgi:futalosine hydrolase